MNKKCISYVITDWYNEDGTVAKSFPADHCSTLKHEFGLFRGDMLVDRGRASEKDATEPLEYYRQMHEVDRIEYWS